MGRRPSVFWLLAWLLSWHRTFVGSQLGVGRAESERPRVVRHVRERRVVSGRKARERSGKSDGHTAPRWITKRIMEAQWCEYFRYLCLGGSIVSFRFSRLSVMLKGTYKDPRGFLRLGSVARGEARKEQPQAGLLCHGGRVGQDGQNATKYIGRCAQGPYPCRVHWHHGKFLRKVRGWSLKGMLE